MHCSIILDPIENNVHDILGFEAVKGRIYEVTGCSDICELAGFLGVREAQISDARRRHMFPEEWLLLVAQKTHTNLQWLLHGKEPKEPQEEADN